MKKLFFLLFLLPFLVKAQYTPTLPPGYLPFATQMYYKIAGGDTTVIEGATGKGFHVVVLNSALKDSLANRSAKFNNDVVINAGSSARIGKYTNGQTIPASGKTLDEFLFDIATATIAPTYTAPTASISGSPGNGTYEIGTALNLTFSSGYTQNDGGAVTSTTYRKGGVALASNTDAITLTTSVSYDVQKAYDQGACKTNNLGQIDCTGRINAGTATSGSITYTPSPKRYWGYTTSTAPSNAEIIASAGGSNALSSSRAGTFTVTASGSNRPFFAYPTSAGDLTSINIGGLESLSAFTKTVVSFTNAQGYTQNYNVYTSGNATASNVTLITQ